MVANGTTGGRAQQGMVAGNVARDAADGGTGQAANRHRGMRQGGGGQGEDGNGSEQGLHGRLPMCTGNSRTPNS